jgi:hypothetical protein
MLKLTVLFFTFVLLSFSGMYAQRMLTEGRVEYSISIDSVEGKYGLQSLFAGATQVIWFKGNMVRVDFNSSLRKQSLLFNAATQTAVLLRESGSEKFMFELDSADWNHFQSPFAGAVYTTFPLQEPCGGYYCQKVIATLPNNTVVEILYTPGVVPVTRSYDKLFEPLNGLPVGYIREVEGLKVHYNLQSVQFMPVGSARFTLSGEGYKQIPYRHNSPDKTGFENKGTMH